MKSIFETLERIFRRFIAYPLLRLLFHNEQIEGFIEPATVRRLIVFRYDRIGDMILTLPFLKALKTKIPGGRVTVLASKANAGIVEASPFVDETVVIQSNPFLLLRQIRKLRRQRFDVVLNLVFNRTTGPGILANLIGPQAAKVGQGPDRYRFYFNRLLKLPRFQQHMLETLRDYVGLTFGVDVTDSDLRPEIYLDGETRGRVDSWLTSNGLRRRENEGGHPYVIFNLSAHDAARRLSLSQVRLVGEFLSQRQDFKTVLLTAPNDQEMASAAKSDASLQKCIVFNTSESRPLIELASIIGGAIMVITPDTSVVHFASAMDTPLLGIYTDLQGMIEWLPWGNRSMIVMAESGRPAGDVNPAKIIRAVEELLSSVKAGANAAGRGTP